MHSVAYEEGYDFNGKRVAVLGAGSSGVQIVTRVQNRSISSSTGFAVQSGLRPVLLNSGPATTATLPVGHGASSPQDPYARLFLCRNAAQTQQRPEALRKDRLQELQP